MVDRFTLGSGKGNGGREWPERKEEGEGYPMLHDGWAETEVTEPEGGPGLAGGRGLP